VVSCGFSAADELAENDNADGPQNKEGTQCVQLRIAADLRHAEDLERERLVWAPVVKTLTMYSSSESVKGMSAPDMIAGIR